MEENKKPRTLEEALAQLNQILEKLEREESTLEESFASYQEGLELVKFANAQIDTIEKKCILVDEDGDLHEF
jgi:exodeoxyribonuclease VII small subunit